MLSCSVVQQHGALATLIKAPHANAPPVQLGKLGKTRLVWTIAAHLAVLRFPAAIACARAPLKAHVASIYR